jgi:hypothetical protein
MKNKLRHIIGQLVKEEFSLMEKKKKPKEEEITLDTDTTIEEPAAEDLPSLEPTTDGTGAEASPDMDMSGGDSTEKQIGKGLQMALDAAKQLPDGEMKNKLIRQIGNTALFFLKTQIPTSGEQM